MSEAFPMKACNTGHNVERNNNIKIIIFYLPMAQNHNTRIEHKYHGMCALAGDYRKYIVLSRTSLNIIYMCMNNVTM